VSNIFLNIDGGDSPNIGREKINYNFSLIDGGITATTTGVTYVSGDTNITALSAYTSSPGSAVYNYGIKLNDNIVLASISATSISAATFYSGSTNLSTLLLNLETGSTYTNSGTTPTTIGGIAAGSTFNTQTMQQMWDALLYPYQAPAFSSFSRTNLNTTYELGEMVSIGSQTFTWATSNSSNVSANTISIAQNTAPGGFIYGPLAANVGSSALTVTATFSAGTATSQLLYTIAGTNSNGAPFSATITRSWMNKRYWGTHPSFTLPSNAQILAANGASVGVGNEFSSTRVQTRNGIDGAGNYLFFAWPTSFGTPSFTVNGLPNTAWTKIGNAISFTNSQAFVVTYDVWISNTAQFSPITLFSIT